MTGEVLEPGFEIQPYPGLRPFREDETHLYFGREGHRGELLKRLALTRFVAVIGTSGSGKSSLVRAGLLPDLMSGYLAGTGSDWVVVESTPGADPVGRLAAAFVNAGWPTDEPELRTNSSRIVDLAGQHLTAGQHLLVLVDQFEELFRLKASDDPAEDADEKAAFVRLLLNAGGQRTDVVSQHPRVHVVMAMRSEFLGRASVYRGLPEAIDQGQYLIPRLSREQLRKAIEAPARVAGGELQEALVQRLLNELGDDQDQLPVLQHALMRCWQFRDADNRIGLEAYEKSGQLASALSIDANEALDEVRKSLGSRGELIVARVFQALRETDVNGGQTRRPTTISELGELAHCTTDDLTAALAPFRQRSFVLPPPDAPLTDQTLVDISHEALLRRWDSLRRWIDEDELDRVRYVRLATRAAEEQDSEHPQYLVSPQLDLFVKFWAERNPPKVWALRHHKGYEQAKVFLDQSEQHRRAREQQEADRAAEELRAKQALAEAVAKRARWKRRTLTLSAVAIAIVVVGGFVLWNALTQQGRLEAQQTRLEASLIASKLASVPEANVGVRLQLGVEAARRLQDLESKQELLKTLFRSPREAGWGADLSGGRSVAISPDDRWIYVVANDHLRRIDFASGREDISMALSAYEGENPEPFLLAAGDKLLMLRGGFVSLIDASTLNLLMSPIHGASAFTVSANGQSAAFLVSGTVILCDLSRNCESSQRHDIERLMADDLELSDDGRHLVIRGQPRSGNLQIALFDTMPWKERRVRTFEGVSPLAMRVDRQHVHVCTADGLQQYDAYDDTLDDRVVREFTPDAEHCRFFGDRTVTNHGDGAIRVWDETGTLVTQIAASVRVEESWRMALGARTLATVGDRLQAWDLTPFGRLNATGRLSAFVRGNAFARGDTELVHLDSGATSSVSNLPGDERVLALDDALTRAVVRAAEGVALKTFSPGTASSDGWNWKSSSPTARVRRATFSPDGHQVVVTVWDVATAGDDSNLKERFSTVILDADNGTEVRTLDGDRTIFFAPNRDVLTFDSNDSEVTLISLDTGIPRGGPTLQSSSDGEGGKGSAETGYRSRPTPRAAAFSPDGKHLALAVARGQSSTIELYQWPLLARAGTLPHTATVTSLSFRSDGLALLASTNEETTHVWDLATQTEVLRIPPPGRQRTTAVFTPEGRVAILQDGRLTVVSVNTDDLILEACRRVARNMSEAEWKTIVGPDIPFVEKTCADRPDGREPQSTDR